MKTSQLSTLQPSLPLTYGVQDGPARILATQTPSVKDLAASEAVSSIPFLHWLAQYDHLGSCWKMCRASYRQTTEPLLRTLSTASKRSGMWGDGLRLTLSMRVCPTTVTEYSLSDLLETTVPITSFLTAANCQGILRREKNGDREQKLDPVFKQALEETIRLWSNVAAASDIPQHQAFAPRYVPKLASIKAAIQTDQYSVARNLTWDECESLMGFPPSWTVVEAGSSVMRSAQSSSNGLEEE